MASDALWNSEYLVSGGYGKDFSFEEDFLSPKSDLKVELYDYSVTYKSICRDLLVSLPISIIRSSIGKQGFGPKFFFNNVTNFVKLKFTSIVYKTYKIAKEDNLKALEISMHSILEKKRNVFLKLDIEESEYEIIDQIKSNAAKLCGIVMEFHYLDRNADLFNRAITDLAESFL